jgi:hypothetical protein
MGIMAAAAAFVMGMAAQGAVAQTFWRPYSRNLGVYVRPSEVGRASAPGRQAPSWQAPVTQAPALPWQAAHAAPRSFLLTPVPSSRGFSDVTVTAFSSSCGRGLSWTYGPRASQGTTWVFSNHLGFFALATGRFGLTYRW